MVLLQLLLGEVSATNLVGSNVSVTGKVVATSVSSGHIFGDIFQGKISFASITGSSNTTIWLLAILYIH